MRSMRFLPATVLALGLAGGLPALPAGGAQLGSAQDNSLRRTIAMSAHTDEGRPVNGLLPGNLRAKMDGREIKILSCDYDTGPHRVVFLLDVSGSMDKLRLVEQITSGNLLGLLNPSSPVAVVAFSSVVDDRLPFTTMRGTARDVIQNLKYIPIERKGQPKRSTSLFDAIEQAIKMLDPVQAGDSICVFSDGADNTSKLGEYQAKKLFSRSGVRIFCFLISGPPRKGLWTSAEASAPTTFITLTKNTGGLYFKPEWKNLEWTISEFATKYPKTAKEQQEIFLDSVRTIAQSINAFYRVEIQLPEPIDKPRGWKLETYDPNAGKHDPKVILHYPARLYPAGN